ncbi:histidinol-phosphate transaminase [Corynebacterium sp. 335C]
MIRPDLADIPAYVPGKDRPGVLKLASNEMAHGPLPSVVDRIREVAAGANRYPDMGASSVREALAEYLGVDAAEVAVGTGSSALCQQLVLATCADGDEVLFPWRSFEAYRIFARVAGAVPVPVPLTADHRHDFDAMADAITDRTRLIFVCNPNNPTGTVSSTAELEAFLDRVPEDVVVALDEAYIELVDGFDPADPSRTGLDTPNALEVMRRRPNVVGLRTFSKVWGLAGLRIGYMFGAADLVEAVNKVCIPFSVTAVSQAAAEACLGAREELLERVAEVREERVRVTDAINAAAGEDVVVPGTQANFLWIPEARIAPLAARVPGAGEGADAAGVAAAVAERGVMVRCFVGEGLRITVTTREEGDRLLGAFGIA